MVREGERKSLHELQTSASANVGIGSRESTGRLTVRTLKRFVNTPFSHDGVSKTMRFVGADSEVPNPGDAGSPTPTGVLNQNQFSHKPNALLTRYGNSECYRYQGREQV